MHSAIIAIELPPETYNAKQGWLAFSAHVGKAVESPAVKSLAPNVWQVNFREAPQALAQLIDGCERFGHTYKILQFDDEPQWLRRESALAVAKTG